MEDLIKKFLNYLQEEKKLSKNTLESYRRDVKNYVAFLNEKELTVLNSNQETILQYVEKMENDKKLPSTISRNIASIRSFYKYLNGEKLVSEDPTKDVESPKIERKAPSILSNSQIELLLEQPKNTDLKGALVSVTGLGRQKL